MSIKWLATGFSVLLPGTGQLITHHWVKGGAFLLAALVASGMLRTGTFLTSKFGGDSFLHFLLVVVLLALAVWSALDAFRSFKETKNTA